MVCLWLIVGTVAGLCAAQEWQQEVRYQIRAELNPTEALLRVHTRMVYRNASPDTLRELYVHLYWNIFAPNSYARQLSRERRLERIPELPAVRVDSFVVIASTGERRMDFSVDNTIVRLGVPKPLLPGDSVEVLSSIVQTVPPEGLRMGRYGTDYFVAHWFPSVCVYDRYGWHTEQYLGTGEFYEEIADFEVELTLPGTYVVVSTGTLANPDEVLPAELTERLRRLREDTSIVRIANLAAQPLTDTTLRTWRFRAERVRTFAWAAVRHYLWDAQRWGNVLVHALYPRELEDFYRDEGLRAAVHAIRYFSEHFGQYPYPQMFVVVGGTSGGMEYPGIVFMGRGLTGGILAPRTAEVIMHEIGHNWYPMVINSNETEFGFQDEGFNTFITMLALEAFYGRRYPALRLPQWLRSLIATTDERTGNAIGTIRWALTGWDEPLLTRSDWHRTEASYVVNAYPKTATLLLMLRGILGEETFGAVVQEYYRRFRFRHVYPEDFVRLVNEVVSQHKGERADFRWFFDQWFSQTPVVDYALAGLRNREAPGGLWDVTVSIERRQSAILPVDVELKLRNGQRERVRFTVEELLRGPSRLEKTVRLPAPAVSALVDPDTVLLLDINRLNNSSGLLPPVTFRPFLEAVSADPVELYSYGIVWQPVVGFNTVDGLKVGVEARGAYLGMFHKVRLSLAQGVRFRPFSFGGMFQWQHLFWQVPARPQLELFGAQQDGWVRVRVGTTLSLSPLPPSAWDIAGRIAVGYWRRQTAAYAFPGSPLGWAPKDRLEVVALKVGLTTSVETDVGTLRLRKSLEPFWYRGPAAPLGVSPFAEGRSFFRTVVECLWEPEVPLPLVLRGVVGWFSSDELQPPPVVGFRLASVSPLEELELPLFRTPGIISPAARERRIVPMGWGFVRGYGALDTLGSVLTALNAEVSVSRLFQLLPAVGLLLELVDLRLFADGGHVGRTLGGLHQWRWDAGFSVALRLPSVQGYSPFPLLRRLGIGEIGVDFPLYLSHPPSGQRQWAYRWLLRLRSLRQATVEW
ncbi:MAG: M1 family metallopeptidase [Chlorobiota bacterium]